MFIGVIDYKKRAFRARKIGKKGCKTHAFTS